MLHYAYFSDAYNDITANNHLLLSFPSLMDEDITLPPFFLNHHSYYTMIMTQDTTKVHFEVVNF